jgi:hypothetical protein
MNVKKIKKIKIAIRDKLIKLHLIKRTIYIQFLEEKLNKSIKK